MPEKTPEYVSVTGLLAESQLSVQVEANIQSQTAERIGRVTGEMAAHLLKMAYRVQEQTGDPRPLQAFRYAYNKAARNLGDDSKTQDLRMLIQETDDPEDD